MNPSDLNAKRRFSDRVDYYLRCRPAYPPEVLVFLRERIGLTPEWIVADIGSGTGISSRLFVDHGNRVFGVEPNREMRGAAERWLAECAGFASVDGSAEAAGLAGGSVDLVVAAQAFHWFDRAEAGREALRILRPGGWAVLLWNERRTDTTPFLRAYEDLLRRYATDYERINHARLGRAEIAEFYGHDAFGEERFDNRQEFDWESLRGRVYSSSYCPLPGAPGHDAMLAELRDIFDRCRDGSGAVAFEYDTRLYHGQVRRG